MIRVQNRSEQLLSSTFIIPKKSEGFRPVISLGRINSCSKYNHFMTTGIFLLNELLEKDDYLYKLDLKDYYFSVLLH